MLRLYGNVYQQRMNSPEDGFLGARKTDNGTDVHGAIEISGEPPKERQAQRVAPLTSADSTHTIYSSL